MPYYVEKSGTSWRLTYREGKRLSRNVPKDSTEAKELGLRPELTVEEARERGKQLKAEAWVKKHALEKEQSTQLTKRVFNYRQAFCSEPDILEFEAKWVKEKRIRKPHWEAALYLIGNCGSHPSDWFEAPSPIYKLCVYKGWSVNYVKKLRRILNFWGYYLCKKQGRTWERLEAPEPYWKRRLIEEQPGIPVPLDVLKKALLVLSKTEARWAERCFWFGLRPHEADEARWTVVKREGQTYLEVFQTKLAERGTPEKRCWKHVPVLVEEQTRAIEELSLPVKRPSDHAFKKAFGRDYSPYGLRHGFSLWLEGRPDVDLERRSRYLGHLSTRTTTRSYTDRTRPLKPRAVG